MRLNTESVRRPGPSTSPSRHSCISAAPLTRGADDGQRVSRNVLRADGEHCAGRTKALGMLETAPIAPSDIPRALQKRAAAGALSGSPWCTTTCSTAWANDAECERAFISVRHTSRAQPRSRLCEASPFHCNSASPTSRIQTSSAWSTASEALAVCSVTRPVRTPSTCSSRGQDGGCSCVEPTPALPSRYMSARLLKAWQKEGVSCACTTRCSTARPLNEASSSLAMIAAAP